MPELMRRHVNADVLRNGVDDLHRERFLALVNTFYVLSTEAAHCTAGRAALDAAWSIEEMKNPRGVTGAQRRI